MERRVWRRESANGNGSIYSVLYREERCGARGIVCILHGMQSHSDRYRFLAEHLSARGYIVTLLDLQGHGRSANAEGSFGPERGWDYMLHDIRRNILQVRKWFPGLPLCLFGHSMGSFLARLFCVRFPGEADALLLSGTAGPSPLYAPVYRFMTAQAKLFGEDTDAKLYGRLLSRYFNRHIKDPVNLGAWCCSMAEVCLSYEDDPLSSSFTIGAYRDMLYGLIQISGEEWFRKMPDIPILLFSGGSDPVGEYGIGPAMVYALLKASGHHDLKLRIYPGKRHETLNEDIRWEVVAMLENWLDQHEPLQRSAADPGSSRRDKGKAEEREGALRER